MIELKHLSKINNEYQMMLEKYEAVLDHFTIDDYKRLIGEVKIFWYRNRKLVSYFLDNIEKEDEVSFLAGAVRLDIINGGHYEYVISGRVRLIDDPFLKMSVIYNGNDTDINFDYINTYLNDCIRDVLEILRHYSQDFYIIPLSLFSEKESKEYHKLISETADKFILSMFEEEYSSLIEFETVNNTYEQIESKLKSYVREALVFRDVQDSHLTLREKCEEYLKENGSILNFANRLCEAQLFVLMVSQYLMQALAITLTMKTYNLIPFIRNDIVFHYFTETSHTQNGLSTLKTQYFS